MCSFRIACSSKVVKSSKLFKWASAPAFLLRLPTVNATENYANWSQNWKIR